MRITLFVEHCEYNTFTTSIRNAIREHIKYTDRFVLLSSRRDIDPYEIKKFTREFPSVEYFFYENIGSDFGKYYHYIVSHQEYLKEYDEMIFTNDSVDVVRPLDKFYSRVNNEKADYIGAIDAYTNNVLMMDVGGRHIQSRRLRMKGKAKDVVIEQILTKGIYPTHTEVIVYYEFGLSRAIRERNITTNTYLKSDELMDKYQLFRCKDYKITNTFKGERDDRGEFNPTFFYYEYLRKEEFPFIKNSHAKHGFLDVLRNMVRFYNAKIYELNAK